MTTTNQIGGGGGGVTSTQVQQQQFNFGVDTGVADAYVVTINPTITSLTDGLLIAFTPTNRNTTTSPTVQIDGLPPTNVFLQNSTNLAPGDFNYTVAYLIYSASFSGFVLLNPVVSIATSFDIQQQTFIWSTDTGTANHYVVANTPPFNLISDGCKVSFVTSNPNTGASDLNVDGFGTQPIVLNGGIALSGGEIVVGYYECSYSTTVGGWVLLNSSLSGVGGLSQQQVFSIGSLRV